MTSILYIGVRFGTIRYRINRNMVPYGTKSSGKIMPMSPRMKAREEETDGTEARKRILGAALSAFMEGGYAQTSTLEIATRARVSKRELYSLFGNKEAMLVACITERAQRLKAPADLPELRDRKILAEGADRFWNQASDGNDRSGRRRGVSAGNIRNRARAKGRASAGHRSPASPRAMHCARSWPTPDQPGFSLAIPTR